MMTSGIGLDSRLTIRKTCVFRIVETAFVSTLEIFEFIDLQICGNYYMFHSLLAALIGICLPLFSVVSDFSSLLSFRHLLRARQFMMRKFPDHKSGRRVLSG